MPRRRHPDRSEEPRGRLELPVAGPLFNIVLLRPEIPNNTGNIGRTAMATGCRLHVVHPIGFSMDEKARRRAGLDYWEHVDCREHASWEAFLASERPARLWLYTAKATRLHWDAPLRRGDHLLFGGETAGVDDATAAAVRARWGEECALKLLMADHPAARSLNLATAVCAAVYEGWRVVRGASDPSITRESAGAALDGPPAIGAGRRPHG